MHPGPRAPAFRSDVQNRPMCYCKGGSDNMNDARELENELRLTKLYAWRSDLRRWPACAAGS